MVLLADTGFGSRQLILCFTFCCQSISLNRQNALDSLNWILVLKLIWQKGESLALIKGNFIPWRKYYFPNLQFIYFNCKYVSRPTGLMICEAMQQLCLHARQNNNKQHSHTAMVFVKPAWMHFYTWAEYTWGPNRVFGKPEDYGFLNVKKVKT